ncbi:MAG TPA: tRNA lysidine(34) synthetase TilS [Candidatus Mediterraneibacter quadrami]|uniref:tRNA(Ile)-lysidine synthase n=1 Tax=Candidatus Mediterraneibacter quadrami TaxID=2838684 RepID=A0A9D2U5K2_9FIRM|nr:tRNA lysidine(34) synthetase TilS [Candidatus Mediterraneibacter quadrami]
MMNRFVEQTEKYVKKLGMIGRDDVVAAGVSGGADSVCLLFVLCALREQIGFTVKVCHVNHGLRGADADADERYVKELCRRLGVECRLFHENVELIAAKRKQSLEEAGRMVRRAALEKMCAEDNCTKIATAHHRDDNAETVLLNIARGTGLRGLCGIWPVRGNWIRPLLWAGRREIEEFLREQGTEWRTDATNEEDIYTRNRIRHRVIPLLERDVNPAAAVHLTELSGQARELWDLLEQKTQEARDRCVHTDESGRLILDITALEAEHPAVRKQLVKCCIAGVLGSEKDIAAVHVRDVLALSGRQSGRMVTLPGGVCADRICGGIRIGRREAAESRRGFSPAPESGDAPRIITRIIEQRDVRLPEDIPQKGYTKWLDYDIIKNSLSIRKRRPGDYLRIDNTGSRQKLKTYFINEKIPREERDKLWLIADGPEIVWIPGYRMNCAYYVTESTERILEIKITEDGTNVRDDQSIDPGRES